MYFVFVDGLIRGWEVPAENRQWHAAIAYLLIQSSDY